MTQEKTNIREYVKQKYSEIAQQSKEANQSSCCGATASDSVADYTVFSDDYSNQEGYYEEADLGLGCGIPTDGIEIPEGSVVLDLGSGAGNDCFVARSMVGEKGQVIGVDFSREMVEKAEANRRKLGYENVEFHEGDIEALPLEAGKVDVVLSNCVLNLVPDKQKAFAEIFRVLNAGGKFSISDVVTDGDLPEAFKEEASLYAGCVSGALPREAYLEYIRQAGFEDIRVHKEKSIQLPESLLKQYLDEEALQAFSSEKIGLFSITVQGVKPKNA